MKTHFRAFALALVLALLAGIPVNATNLVGKDNPAASGASGINGNVLKFYWLGFTATASGTANKLRVYIDNNPSATSMKMAIYNSSHALIGQTAAITSITEDAWNEGDIITPVAITSGQTYFIGLMADDLIRPRATADDPGGFINTTQSVTYPTVPSTITPSDDESLPQFAIYADGTTGGGLNGSMFLIF